MRSLLCFLLLAPLASCGKSDIPIPPSGPGRQEAICAISFSQWLAINSYDVQITSRATKGRNAVFGLGARERPIVGRCEITPEYAVVSMTLE